MSLKSRITVWYIAERFRKAFGMTRAEWRFAMKPFPKWFGVLSAVIAGAPAVAEAYKTGGWMPACMTILGLLGVLNSHSLPGTGGKP